MSTAKPAAPAVVLKEDRLASTSKEDPIFGSQATVDDAFWEKAQQEHKKNLDELAKMLEPLQALVDGGEVPLEGTGVEMEYK